MRIPFSKFDEPEDTHTFFLKPKRQGNECQMKWFHYASKKREERKIFEF